MRAMPAPPITALLWEWWDESAMPSAIDETAPYPYSITSAERVGGAAMTPAADVDHTTPRPPPDVKNPPHNLLDTSRDRPLAS